jgi:transcription elongation factor Elf1
MPIKRKAVKKKAVRAALHHPKDKFTTCPHCKVRKKYSDYWDAKRKRKMKFCRECDSAKRIADKKNRPLTYREYINSHSWKSKRVEYWNDPYTLKECYVCADPWVDFKGKELHHRTYDRFGNERLDDLVPVCPNCHKQISSRWVIEKKKPYAERKTLWEITDLIQEQVRGIVF